jgi:hypothetical protein
MSGVRRGVLALALVLVACSSGGGGTPSSAPASPQTPAQRFVSLLRTDHRAQGLVLAYSDAELLSRGREACGMITDPNPGLMDGATVAVNQLIRDGDDASTAAAIVWAAKRQLCPVKSP